MTLDELKAFLKKPSPNTGVSPTYVKLAIPVSERPTSTWVRFPGGGPNGTILDSKIVNGQIFVRGLFEVVELVKFLESKGVRFDEQGSR